MNKTQQKQWIRPTKLKPLELLHTKYKISMFTIIKEIKDSLKRNG